MNNGMRLLILSAEDEDSGNYTCLAVNRINNDTYTIALDVQSECMGSCSWESCDSHVTHIQ